MHPEAAPHPVFSRASLNQKQSLQKFGVMRENVYMYEREAFRFGLTSCWLRKWHEAFQPITERSNAKSNYFRHSHENRSITE